MNSNFKQDIVEEGIWEDKSKKCSKIKKKISEQENCNLGIIQSPSLNSCRSILDTNICWLNKYQINSNRLLKIFLSPPPPPSFCYAWHILFLTVMFSDNLNFLIFSKSENPKSLEHLFSSYFLISKILKMNRPRDIILFSV